MQMKLSLKFIFENRLKRHFATQKTHRPRYGMACHLPAPAGSLELEQVKGYYK